MYSEWGKHRTCRKSLARVLGMRWGRIDLWEPQRGSARQNPSDQCHQCPSGFAITHTTLSPF